MTALKHKKKKNTYQPKMNYRGSLYLINDSNTKTTVIHSEETATISCPINREPSKKEDSVVCLSMTTLKHKKKNIYQPKMNYRGNLYLFNDSKH